MGDETLMPPLLLRDGIQMPERWPTQWSFEPEFRNNISIAATICEVASNAGESKRTRTHIGTDLAIMSFWYVIERNR